MLICLYSTVFNIPFDSSYQDTNTLLNNLMFNFGSRNWGFIKTYEIINSSNEKNLQIINFFKKSSYIL